MPIFAMLFALALFGLAVVLLAGWFVSLGFLIKGRKKQSRSQVWFAGVPLVLISGLGLWLSYLIFAPPNAANAYIELFGVAPSQDVTEMRAHEDGIGDNRQVYLRFNASPATVKHITAKDWFKEDADDWAKHGGETLYNLSCPLSRSEHSVEGVCNDSGLKFDQKAQRRDGVEMSWQLTIQ